MPKLPKGGAGGDGETDEDVQERIAAMRLEMFTAAENLEFEKAARLRDELKKLEALAGGETTASAGGEAFDPYAASKKSRRGRGTVKAKPAAARNGKRYKAR